MGRSGETKGRGWFIWSSFFSAPKFAPLRFATGLGRRGVNALEALLLAGSHPASIPRRAAFRSERHQHSPTASPRGSAITPHPLRVRINPIPGEFPRQDGESSSCHQCWGKSPFPSPPDAPLVPPPDQAPARQRCCKHSLFSPAFPSFIFKCTIQHPWQKLKRKQSSGSKGKKQNTTNSKSASAGFQNPHHRSLPMIHDHPKKPVTGPEPHLPLGSPPVPQRRAHPSACSPPRPRAHLAPASPRQQTKGWGLAGPFEAGSLSSSRGDRAQGQQDTPCHARPQLPAWRQRGEEAILPSHGSAAAARTPLPAAASSSSSSFSLLLPSLSPSSSSSSSSLQPCLHGVPPT